MFISCPVGAGYIGYCTLSSWKAVCDWMLASADLARTSMLPVSGAEQLITSEANTTRPICSLRKAYSCASTAEQLRPRQHRSPTRLCC